MREHNLRVLFVTVTPDFVPIADRWFKERGHRVIGALTAPGPRTRRTDGFLGVAQHARPGFDVIVSNYPNRWADMVRPLKPDLIFCASFNWKIPGEVLDVPRLGAINGHDALLPKYRGRNATGWALRNDEPEYGVTFHRMTPEFDDGPILSQRRVPIADHDDIEAIRERFFASAEAAFHDAMERIEINDPGTPQDETQATNAGGAFEPEWRYIDWNRPARDIFIQVRSWYGARDVPLGAFGAIDGRNALITKTRLPVQQITGALPGTVLERRQDDSLLIQCGDGPLEIVAWEVDESPVFDKQQGMTGREQVRAVR